MKKLLSNKHPLLFLLIFIFLFSQACNKTQEQPKNEEKKETCKNFPPLHGINTGYKYIYGYPFLGQPCYNPANQNEIVYVVHFYGVTSASVYKKNLATGDSAFVADQVWSGPEWSSKDWIVFEKTDRQIWKIKSNGDSLMQLTFSGKNYFPKWSPDGEKITFTKGENGAGIYIMNNDGSHLQLLDSFFFRIPGLVSIWR